MYLSKLSSTPMFCVIDNYSDVQLNIALGKIYAVQQDKVALSSPTLSHFFKSFSAT